jgi:hypothetical protein
MVRALSLAVLLAAGLVGAAGAQPAMIPELRPEGPPPPPPGERYVWQPGHWHWNGRDWVWIRGHYVVRAAGWHEFVPGHWGNRGGEWVWIPAHWR